MADREKTIKEMTVLRNWLLHMEEFNAHGNSDMYHEFGCTVYSALEILKEQEAKTGKWILDDEDANSWKCSECGDLLIINDGTPHENNWHFCPYCGTKLEEEKVKWDV